MIVRILPQPSDQLDVSSCLPRKRKWCSIAICPIETDWPFENFTKFQSLPLCDLSRFNYQTFTPETRSSISLMIINIPFCREQSNVYAPSPLHKSLQFETRFKPFNLNLTVITANQFGRRCFTHPNDFMTFHGDWILTHSLMSEELCFALHRAMTTSWREKKNHFTLRERKILQWFSILSIQTRVLIMLLLEVGSAF